ncbi:MAG: hypothetical protein KAT71_06320 [Gammaproteobacteria bacterium]|nr:hypothetical protein [Gammaproteobacteria bacterium]
MTILDKEHKTKLGELLAAGHRHFGKVMPRKPYRDEDDDDGGGAGSAELSPFEQHPLLAEQPLGAPSDLTAIVTENRQAEAEAEKRDAKELSNQLQNQLSHTHAQKQTHSHTAKPTPT